MATPITSPYPLFGPDNYAYLRTLIRYNTMKSGYDSTIYSAISPDYINPGDIGPQSKVKEHGSYEKYTSLITDDAIENLAFRIMVPVRTDFKAIICAEMLEWEKKDSKDPKYPNGIWVLSNQPTGWSYGEYEYDENKNEKFSLPYSIASPNDSDSNQVTTKEVDYFFAPVLISNYDKTGGALYDAHKNKLIKQKVKEGDTDSFFQKQIDPATKGVTKRRFVIRVNMTILDKNDNLMDQREDAIILEIYDKIDEP